MSRRARILAISCACILLVVAIFLALLPTLASSTIDTQLRDTLAKRKINASWSSLSLSWSGLVVMEGVDIQAPERGVDLKATRIEVDAAVTSFLGDTPRLESVALTGVTLRADGAKLQASLDKPPKPKKPKKPKQPSVATRFQKALTTHPPTVTLKEVELAVAYEDADIASVTIEKGELAGDEARLAWIGNGTMAATHKRVPVIWKQPKPWAMTAWVEPKTRKAHLEVDSGTEERPLLDIAIPTFFKVAFSGATVDLSFAKGKDRVVDLEVRGVDASLGPAEEPIVGLTADRLATSVLRERPAIELERPIFEVDPTRLGKLTRKRTGKKKRPSLREMFSNPFAKKGSKEKEPSPEVKPAPPGEIDTKRLTSVASTLVDLLWRFDFDVRDATLGLRLAQEDGAPAQRIKLVEALYALTEAGMVEARGRSAGGTFEAAATFHRDQWWPATASLQAHDVDIEKIPGVAGGRTLPNRGLRGNIGGVIDLGVDFAAPFGVLPDPRDAATAAISVSWRDGKLALDGLAEEPLEGIEFSTSATVELSPGTSSVAIQDGKVRYGKIKADYQASLRDLTLDPYLRMRVKAEYMPCQDMVDSIPDALLGPLKDVVISGQAAPELTVRVPLRKPTRLKLELDHLSKQDNPKFRRKYRRRSKENENGYPPIQKDWYCEIKALKTHKEGRQKLVVAPSHRSMRPEQVVRRAPERVGADVRWLKRPFIRQVPEEGLTEQARRKKLKLYVGPGLETYTRLASMPKYVGAAAFLSEEILFYSNRGVNQALLVKAIRIDLERGRFVYGGSTVTQQLVKNLFLSRKKTLARKLQEALIALRMDEVLSKDKILELYLNCIEFGINLYGIGPAAEHYFQRPASQLTPLQAVFLAVIKPSPQYGDHLKRRGSTPAKGWMQKRMETIFKRLVEYEYLTQEEADAQRPYVLKWDAEGKYIDPAPKEPESQPADGLIPGVVSPISP